MADHVHTQIVEALVTALTGLATTGAHVYANRLHPLAESTLPAMRLSLDQESVEGYTLHPNPILDRRLTVVVEACVLADDGSADATVEQIQKEVEIALAAGISPGGHHLDVLYTGSNYDDEAGGLDAAVRRMEFRIDFSTPANAPDTFA